MLGARRMCAVYTHSVRPPCVERIRGLKGLEAARGGGRGAVRGPLADDVLHALSCSRLYAMAAEDDAAELCLYRGLAEARKADPGIKLCGECDPEAGEMRDALNRSGAFLHEGVIQDLKDIGYNLFSELPVSTAPFLSDPSRQPGAVTLRDPPGGNRARLLNKTAFQGAVAASQDGSQRRGRTIDICASRSGTASAYTAVIEVKRLDPAYVSWVFLARGGAPRDFSVVTRSYRPDGGALQLMRIPRSDAEGGDIYVHKKRAPPLPDHMGAVADRGMEITYDPRAGYSHRGTSLHDAANQVLEGAFGLIVDVVTNHAAAGTIDVLEEHYVPIIVTTANLLTCEYDPAALDPERLDAPDAALKKADMVIYRCPHPPRTRFPDQIVATRNAAQAALAARWPVAVATVGGLRSLLRSPLVFHGATGRF